MQVKLEKSRHTRHMEWTYIRNTSPSPGGLIASPHDLLPVLASGVLPVPDSALGYMFPSSLEHQSPF